MRWLTVVLLIVSLGCSSGGSASDADVLPSVDAVSDLSGPGFDAPAAPDAADDVPPPPDHEDVDGTDDVPPPPLDIAAADVPIDDAAAPPETDTSAVDAMFCTPECPEGETRCDGARSVATCTLDATGCSRWGAPVACGTDEACSDGACGPACAAEDTRCLDAVTLQTCQDGQMGQTTCPNGCDAVARACTVCPVGGWLCRARPDGMADLLACPSGATWSLRAVCQECACDASGPSVVMQCRFASEDVPTTCTRCSEDAAQCFP